MGGLINVKKLIITPENGVLFLPETIRTLNNFESIEVKCNEDLISIISGISCLENCKIFKLKRDTELKFEDIEALKWLPMPISLELINNNTTEVEINSVFSLHNLSKLVLNGNFILNNEIIDFESTNLKFLDINNVFSMPNIFKILEKMPNIENLEINDSQNVKVEQIIKLPLLKTFNLTSFNNTLVSKFNIKELAANDDDLQKFGKLEEFIGEYCLQENNKNGFLRSINTSEELKFTKNLILERLSIKDIQMNRKIADTIISFRNLNYFKLTNIADLKPFFRILSDLKNLVSLDLNEISYKNEDINKMLSGLSIKELKMNECNQSTDSKEKIQLPRTLKFLEIRNQNLSNEFIIKLAELSNLEESHLPGCILDKNLILSLPFFNKFEINMKRDEKGNTSFDSFKRKISNN